MLSQTQRESRELTRTFTRVDPLGNGDIQETENRKDLPLPQCTNIFTSIEIFSLGHDLELEFVAGF